MRVCFYLSIKWTITREEQAEEVCLAVDNHLVCCVREIEASTDAVDAAGCSDDVVPRDIRLLGFSCRRNKVRLTTSSQDCFVPERLTLSKAGAELELALALALALLSRTGEFSSSFTRDCTS